MFVRLKQISIGLVLGSLFACGGGGDNVPQNTSGTLSLGLIDAPIDDVDEIWIEIAGVAVKPQGAGPAMDFDFTQPLQVDLLSLTDGNSEMLLDGEVLPAGAYSWIELKVNAEFDSNLDSYVVTDSGGVEEMSIELQVPGGSQTGVRLVSGFTITANQETSFLIDWDMRLGLKKPPGQAGYLLRPAFRIIDMTEFGTLNGTVDMALVTDSTCSNDLNQDTGNTVYVFADFDADVDDIDGTDDPVATIAVTQNNMGDYTYEAILSPGQYTIAFTCQASDDDPDTDETNGTPIEFIMPLDPNMVNSANVTIDDGVTVTVDF